MIGIGRFLVEVDTLNVLFEDPDYPPVNLIFNSRSIAKTIVRTVISL